MLKIRRVPWRNKSEWMEVYENLFAAEELAHKVAAVQSMDSWINKGNCPPAVEYTCRFLQSVTRDPHFYPNLSNSETEANLQLQYATSILRFINILSEVESLKALSLNARALKIGLPEWIVNTRHQISHGSSLPSLDILRLSVKCLLDWLKENYWDVEKVAMGDLILPNSAPLLKENITTLLTIYAFLNDELDSGTQLVRDIQDVKMKNKLKKFNSVLFHTYYSETCPWDATMAKSSDSILNEIKKIFKLSIASALNIVVRSIKPYFACRESAKVVEFFVDFILQESLDRELCWERWQSLLVALHSRNHFPAIINKLLDVICRNGSAPDHAAEWAIILLKSLLKRMKAEKKLQQISGTSIPSSKRLKLNLTEKEKRLLTKDRIKHQLSFETANDESQFDVLAKLFEVVERKNPHLKLAPRLQDIKFLTEREIHQMIIKIFLSPNRYTKPISELLLNMSSSLTLPMVNNLLQLMKIKESPVFDTTKNIETVFDSTSLARCLTSKSHIPNLLKTDVVCSQDEPSIIKIAGSSWICAGGYDWDSCPMGGAAWPNLQ